MVSIKAARRAGVPLVVIETADPQQTISLVCQELNGKNKDVPLMQWDIIRLLVGLNPAGVEEVARLTDNNPIAAANPAETLSILQKAGRGAITFWHNIHLMWDNYAIVQGIWNLRDIYKGNGSMLVMLTPFSVRVPDEIKNDCIILTDTLPTYDEVVSIVDGIAKDAEISEQQLGDKEKVVDTLLGLSAFAAEQVLAMSITKKEGIDLNALWERKRRMIEQTKGLSVWRGGETFDDIGGYDNVKKFLKAIVKGRKAPRTIVFIDEIEKAMAGSQTDTSGVSQDYLRNLLTWMQDKEALGTIFVGPPGTSKSMMAKAAGNEAGIPTIALDLGGMKGSLVGESERALRTALAVIEAVSQGQVLFIATSNSIGILPPELRRRFSLGTFFFPLPDAADRKLIWDKYLTKYEFKKAGSNLTTVELPDDEGWTGAEIRNCAMIAWRLKCSLKDAAKYIVPVSVSARDQIERLCKEAHRRYISASEEGFYEYVERTTQTSRRVFQT